MQRVDPVAVSAVPRERFRRPVLGPEVQSHGIAWRPAEGTRAERARGPRFTIVVPVWNTRPDALGALLASIRTQRYPHWDLSVVDDASTDPETLAVLDALAAEPRARVTRLDRNSGIVRATRAALEHATGEWIAFADHDDVLHPDALADVARLVAEVPQLELVYTDQDRLRDDGEIDAPSYKPAWSPDLLRSTNCVVHLCCYRRALVESLGAVREGFDGSQDYDLLLRASDGLDPGRVGHVARPRYHWRAAPGSVAADPAAKPWAYDAARRALEESLARRGWRGRVDPHDVTGWYHTRYEVPQGTRATVVVVGPDGRASDATRAALANAANVATRVSEVVHARDHAEAAARAAAAAAELAVVVGAGVVVEPGWLDALAEHAQRPEVAAVGGTVLDAAGSPTFGLVLGGGTEPVVAATPGVAPDDFAWSGRVVRNLSAVPFVLAAFRPALVAELGWDADLTGDLLPADLCLRARQRGMHVVTTPHAQGRTVRPVPPARTSARAVSRFRTRWHLDERGDPFLNPNLEPFGDPRAPSRERKLRARVGRALRRGRGR
jgi:glycosyltransferase involved in cell wall biosynthesis